MRKFTSLPAVLALLCSIVLAKTRKIANRVIDKSESLVAFATILIKETKSAVSYGQTL